MSDSDEYSRTLRPISGQIAKELRGRHAAGLVDGITSRPTIEQIAILETIYWFVTKEDGHGPVTTWPKWGSVVAQLDTEDIEVVLGEMPTLSRVRFDYSLTWREQPGPLGRTSRGERVGLTLAGLQFVDPDAAARIVSFLAECEVAERSLPVDADKEPSGNVPIARLVANLASRPVQAGRVAMTTRTVGDLLRREYLPLAIETSQYTYQVELGGRLRFLRGVGSVDDYLRRTARLAANQSSSGDSLWTPPAPAPPAPLLHNQGMDLPRRLELLDIQIAAAPANGAASNVNDWRNETEVVLRRLLGEEAPIFKSFKAVKYTPGLITGNTDYDSFRRAGVGRAVSVLRSAKTDLRLADEFSVSTSAATQTTPSVEPATGTAVEQPVSVDDQPAGEPRVFIASSVEGLPIAQALQRQLDHGHEVRIWSQGVFTPGSFGLESLLQATREVDFAVFVVDADDTTISRDQTRNATRDNVVFELGLFLGAIGRDRCFMVFDRTRLLDLPSDLAGVNPVNYRIHASRDLDASLGAAASSIAVTMTKVASAHQTEYVLTDSDNPHTLKVVPRFPRAQ